MIKLIKNKLNFIAGDVIQQHRTLTPKIYQNLNRLMPKIKGRTIIHVNSTRYGGGVAEILKSQVPLENSLGLRSYWFTMRAPRRFFVVTKKIHNLLQGKAGIFTEKEKNFYLSINRELGESLKRFCQRFNSGIVIIHDPQPLPMVGSIPENFSSILRLHIDLSTPNPNMLDFLRPIIAQYSLVALSDPDYRLSFPWLKKSKIKIILPAINPFDEKNRFMDNRIAEDIVKQFGINSFKPIIVWVSRFDPWKDPLGVIRAYYLAKNKIPELQLVLAGFSLAKDDPEAMTIFEKVKKHAKGDPDIHLFLNPKKLKDVSVDIFINALYTTASIIIQKSLREGFGLTITEAMWKGKAVIAGLTEGATLQIKNGKNGILVSSPEEAAKAIVSLIKNEKLRQRLGKTAHQSVKRKFLMLRFILDNVKVYNQLINN